MSFQNYDSFNNQQVQQEAGGPGPGAPQQQDAPMVGQHPDNPQAQFQPGNPGDPSAAGGPQQGGEAKTTLWYALLCLATSSSPFALCESPQPSGVYHCDPRGWSQ